GANYPLSDAQQLRQWRGDLQRCALAAALSMKTYPVACEQAQRAEALKAFRSHVATKTVQFEMQPIWRLYDKAVSGHEMLARLPGRTTVDWIPHIVDSHDSITLAKLALVRAHRWLNETPKTYASVN
ncbi:hypothetical protein RZS08_48945, partial [Arthrospira platensis SPKY1]|nr:hypothetical protein [Arthrospira platensis SPKY1]